MSTEPMADIREMYLAHSMFRREFGLLPALISGVAAADAERAAVVERHYELVHGLLHHHHQAEDTYLWPRLAVRAPQEATPVTQAMESQHAWLDKVLADLTDGLRQWRETGDQAAGTALAETAGLLNELLTEHLAAEEDQALPLIARHITAAEWGEMAQAGAASLDPAQMPLSFGMMTYEGDPELIGEIISHMPSELQPVIADLASAEFARYCERVHGTPIPAKSGEL